MLVEIERRQDHDLGIRRLDQPAAGLDAVHAGHADVHEDDVGIEAGGLLDRLDSCRRFADDAQVVLGLQDQAQPGPHHRLVIDEQQPDHGTRASTGMLAWTRQPGPGWRGPALRAPPTVASRSAMPNSP